MSTAAALVLAVGLGSEANAQEMMGRRISRFDLGVYAGGSLTSPWFESRTVTVAGGQVTEGDDGEGYTPGYAPVFGAMATYWATPGFGVRIHGAYLPMRRPFAGSFGATTPDEGDDDSWALNTYLYDLDLVFRPFVMSGSNLFSSVYFFLGGGGLTTDVAGSRGGCDPATLSRGACLTFDPEFGRWARGWTCSASAAAWRCSASWGCTATTRPCTWATPGCRRRASAPAAPPRWRTTASR
jgi:hypothetical protein